MELQIFFLFIFGNLSSVCFQESACNWYTLVFSCQSLARFPTDGIRLELPTPLGGLGTSPPAWSACALFLFTVIASRVGKWSSWSLLLKPPQGALPLLWRLLGASLNTSRRESLSENGGNTEESTVVRGMAWAFWGHILRTGIYPA